MCVDRRKRRVLCSVTISPSFISLVSRVFLLHSVARLHWPWVIGTTRESATLYALPASGSPSRFGFMIALATSATIVVGLPWVRRTASTICRPASLWGGSPDIRSRLVTSARPPPHSHIAGSLFATYTVVPHASSRPIITDDALALLALPFRPVTAGVLLPALRRKFG